MGALSVIRQACIRIMIMDISIARYASITRYTMNVESRLPARSLAPVVLPQEDDTVHIHLLNWLIRLNREFRSGLRAVERGGPTSEVASDISRSSGCGAHTWF